MRPRLLHRGKAGFGFLGISLSYLSSFERSLESPRRQGLISPKHALAPSKVLIAELIASAPNEEFYDAKVKVLSEQIEHHVHEEEKRSEGIFSQAQAAGIDMDELGDRLMARKEAVLGEYNTGVR
jgi:hypothetical protein